MRIQLNSGWTWQYGACLSDFHSRDLLQEFFWRLKLFCILYYYFFCLQFPVLSYSNTCNECSLEREPPHKSTTGQDWVTSLRTLHKERYKTKQSGQTARCRLSSVPKLRSSKRNWHLFFIFSTSTSKQPTYFPPKPNNKRQCCDLTAINETAFITGKILRYAISLQRNGTQSFCVYVTGLYQHC